MVELHRLQPIDQSHTVFIRFFREPQLIQLLGEMARETRPIEPPVIGDSGSLVVMKRLKADMVYSDYMWVGVN